jgi:hypothetical protein
MAKKDPPKTPPAKKGSAKGVKTPVRGIHHDVSAREERRKEMNQKRNVKYHKQKSDEKKAKEKHQRQAREANKHMKNQAIIAKLKPVRVEKSRPKEQRNDQPVRQVVELRLDFALKGHSAAGGPQRLDGTTCANWWRIDKGSSTNLGICGDWGESGKC